jgi:hypothetical protein
MSYGNHGLFARVLPSTFLSSIVRNLPPTQLIIAEKEPHNGIVIDAMEQIHQATRKGTISPNH